VAEFYQRCFGVELPEIVGQCRAELRPSRTPMTLLMSSNIKPRKSVERLPDRAIQGARSRDACARSRASLSSKSAFRRGKRPGIVRRQGAPARSRRESSAARMPRSCAGHPPTRSRLKLACHDPLVHRKLVHGRAAGARPPYSRRFEQGPRRGRSAARRMSGVAKNLSAMLDDRFHRGKFDPGSPTGADAPIEEAVAMMVRGAVDRPSPAACG